MDELADRGQTGRTKWVHGALGFVPVVSVSFGAFVMVTTEFLPIGLLSSIAGDFGISEGPAGWMVSLPGLTAAASALLAANYLNRLDRRLVLLALTALVLGSSVVAALSANFAIMLVGRLMLGAAVGGFWAFAAGVARRLVRAQWGSAATGVVLGGISLGAVVGLPMGTAIGQMFGWRTAFETSAVMACVAGFVQWRYVPSLPPVQSSRIKLRALVSRRPLFKGLIISAAVTVGHFAAYTYLEPFLTKTVSMNGNQLAWTLFGYGLAGIAGTALVTPFADRSVDRSLQSVAVLLSLAILALAFSGSNIVGAACAVVLWGAAFGAVPACVQIWVYKAAPESFDSASAWAVTVFQAALASGAWLGGLLTTTITQTMILSSSAVFIALVAVSMAFIHAGIPPSSQSSS